MMTELRIWLPAQLRGDQALCAEISAACPSASFYPSTYDGVTDIDSVDGQEIDVLVSEALPRNLERWPRLRFVQVVAAGIDYLKGHPIWKTQIPIATARGVHSVPIAEHVTGMLLQMAHRFPETTQFGNSWSWPDRISLAGKVLRNKTVGIVGYGSIGSECGRQLHALGMRVLACKRQPERPVEAAICWPGTGDPEMRIPEATFAPQDLALMLPRCGALVISAAKTDDTVGLIGKAELSLLPRGAWIVVVSRGGIVDEVALATALQEGTIGGAAIDTYSQEPPPADHPLHSAPRLIATPHMSGVYVDIWKNIGKILCENLRRLIEERPLVNLATAP